MDRWFALALCFTAATAACAGADAPYDDSGFENVGDNSDLVIGDIEWRLRSIPEMLEPGARQFDAVEFGQCESAEPEDPDTDVEIHCTNPWAEVAWYVIPAGQLAVGQTLRATFNDMDDANRVRASIHEVAESGDKRKLATHPMLFAGESIEAAVEAELDHYIFVARGRTLEPLWGNGSISYSVTATVD